MRVVIASLAFSACLLGPAGAEDVKFACQREANVRTVFVVPAADEVGSCEVRYDKSSEGEDERVIWRAQNDFAFCRDKAESLASRLASAGWSCEPALGRAAMAPEPMSVPAKLSAGRQGEGVTAAIGGPETAPMLPDDMSIEGRQMVPTPAMRPTLN